MNVRSLATGIAALSLVGVTVALPATAAFAQEQGSSRCAATGAGSNANPNAPGGPSEDYPPRGQGAGVSDSSAEPGQPMTASAGCREFAPGQRVRYGVESKYQELGVATADRFGEVTATFEVPTNLAPGRHHVVFTGPSFEDSSKQNVVRVPFTVVNAAAGTRGSLPRTGSEDLVALALGGGAMVALGAGMVVVARRRRTSMPAGIA